MKLITTSGNKTFKIIPRQYIEGAITKNGTSVIYKDKVFCTDQTINQTNNDYYSINKDEYVQEDSFDNDYIIL
jgi:CMP-N-acetylneuraminic acid synthetase